MDVVQKIVNKFRAIQQKARQNNETPPEFLRIPDILFTLKAVARSPDARVFAMPGGPIPDILGRLQSIHDTSVAGNLGAIVLERKDRLERKFNQILQLLESRPTSSTIDTLRGAFHDMQGTLAEYECHLSQNAGLLMSSATTRYQLDTLIRLVNSHEALKLRGDEAVRVVEEIDKVLHHTFTIPKNTTKTPLGA